MKPASLRERFFAKVNKRGPISPHVRGRCWLWTDTHNPQGFGMIRCDGPMRLVNRVAWFLHYGRWPNPCALRRCDNRACVRWSHLWEGTKTDSMREAERKGRLKHLRRRELLKRVYPDPPPSTLTEAEQRALFEARRRRFYERTAIPSAENRNPRTGAIDRESR